MKNDLFLIIKFVMLIVFFSFVTLHCYIFFFKNFYCSALNCIIFSFLLQLIKSALMKIDSEGSEKKVIKGVRHFLRRVNIPFNAMEMLVLKRFIAANQSKNEVRDSLKMMTNLGFVEGISSVYKPKRYRS